MTPFLFYSRDGLFLPLWLFLRSSIPPSRGRIRIFSVLYDVPCTSFTQALFCQVVKLLASHGARLHCTIAPRTSTPAARLMHNFFAEVVSCVSHQTLQSGLRQPQRTEGRSRLRRNLDHMYCIRSIRVIDLPEQTAHAMIVCASKQQ